MGLKNYRNKEGMKTQEHYPAAMQKSGGKERLEDYSFSVAKSKSGNKCRV